MNVGSEGGVEDDQKKEKRMDSRGLGEHAGSRRSGFGVCKCVCTGCKGSVAVMRSNEGLRYMPLTSIR